MRLDPVEAAAGPEPSRCRRALTWLADTIDQFDPFRSSPMGHPQAPFVPLLELLHLARVSFAGWSAIDPGAAHELAVAIHRLLRRRSDRFGELAVADEGRFYRAWLMLEVRQALHQEVAPHAGIHLPRRWLPPGPYADLEHAYVCGSLPGTVEDPRASAGLPEVFAAWTSTRDFCGRMTSQECYELTHAIFYATNFGRTVGELPASAALIEVVVALLDRAVQHGQLDLVAELAAALSVLGAHEHPVLGVAWAGLNSAQLPERAVPGPSFSIDTYRQVAKNSVRTYLFATCYHTTLVTCLAAALGGGSREITSVPRPSPALVL